MASSRVPRTLGVQRVTAHVCTVCECDIDRDLCSYTCCNDGLSLPERHGQVVVRLYEDTRGAVQWIAKNQMGR